MAGVEGFLSLDEAAHELKLTVLQLSKHIDEGRVVAIVRDSSSWLSLREISRLRRQLQRSSDGASETSKHATSVNSQLALDTASSVSAPDGQSLEPESLRLSKNDSPPEEDIKIAQEIDALKKRCLDFENSNRGLEETNARLKRGLQETEATLKRSRATRTSLEDEVLSLQDQYNRVRARSEALEREVQHLSAELERKEDIYSSELRRFRSKGDAQSTQAPLAELEAVRSNMAEKDRLLAQQYQEIAFSRSQFEEMQQKFFELKARYEKEKAEWSETVARAYQNHNQMREQIEELRARTSTAKGWNPFRREK